MLKVRRRRVEPAAFDIPTLCLVPAVSGFDGGLRGGVLPEVLVEVFVFQDAEHQRLVVLEHGNQMAGAIQRVDLPKKCLPTSAIGGGFQSGLIPLAVKRVEGDPLVEQDLIGVANRIKLFDPPPADFQLRSSNCTLDESESRWDARCVRSPAVLCAVSIGDAAREPFAAMRAWLVSLAVTR